MKYLDEKYLVITGGAGFIGSCLVRHLNDLGITNLAIFDDLQGDERWKNLVGKSFLELRDHRTLLQWLEGRQDEIEGFIHLGACSDTTCFDANYLLENNTNFSIALAEYALLHNHRFIYASSAATYGMGEAGFNDDHALLEQLRPLNMYGYSKHLFDLWLKRHDLLSQVTGLKYFNIFGPNEYHKKKMASAIVKMTDTAINEGKIYLFESNDPQYNNGEQLRDFLYVKDAVAMTAHFLKNDLCGIYNIGSGKAKTWNELAQGVIKALGRKIKIVFIPMPEKLQGKYQYFTEASMTKSAEHQAQLPQYGFEESIKDYVCNYLLEHQYL